MRETRAARMLYGTVAIAIGIALAGLVIVPAQPAQAVSGSDFDPGNIISDQNFFNAAALSESQTQAFLAGIGCSPRDGVPCLKDFTQSTPTVPAVGGGHCAQYDGGSNERASRIIVKVAQACGISPKVLLVLLQKEQSLLTSPNSYGYARAMGWGCPDTGPNSSANCDANYFGFFNQTYKSAWQFRQYTQYPINIPGESGTRKYRIGSSFVQYHPNASCGGTTVNIQNQATANLYLYTPYQPNAAALQNLYGTGDGCSAYGNRNFWRIYSDWFGNPAGYSLSPLGNFESGSAAIDKVTLRGWAFDPETASPIDVHLYVDGHWGGAFKADVSRLDIASAYPSYGPNHGFEINFPLPTSTFEACVYAINVGAAGSNQLLGCKTMSPPSGPPMGNVESQGLSDGQATLSGWVIDPDTAAPLGVHVYVNGSWGGAFIADRVRNDVGRAYPGYGSAHGFQVTVPVPVGTSNVCVYGINVGGGYNQLVGCRSVSTASGPPVGDVNSVVINPGSIGINGWALDPDSPSPVDIHVYVDGRWGGAFRADVVRSDVARAFPGYGENHGFSAQVGIPGGSSNVCVYAINVGAGFNQGLGCRTITSPSGPPIGDVNALTVNAGSATLSGWALDPDTAVPVDVHVYVNGAWGGSIKADAVRDDVGRAYPSYGPNHGFSGTVALPGGSSTVCVYAINKGIGFNQQIGCRNVLVPTGSPFGSIDSMSVAGAVTTVSGWALDPDTTNPIAVHAYVNGQWGGAFTAGSTRDDVGRAYPASGPNHGFAIPLTLGAGRQQVCVYGINVGPGFNQLLGCSISNG